MMVSSGYVKFNPAYFSYTSCLVDVFAKFIELLFFKYGGSWWTGEPTTDKGKDTKHSDEEAGG